MVQTPCHDRRPSAVLIACQGDLVLVRGKLCPMCAASRPRVQVRVQVGAAWGDHWLNCSMLMAESHWQMAAGTQPPGYLHSYVPSPLGTRGGCMHRRRGVTTSGGRERGQRPTQSRNLPAHRGTQNRTKQDKSVQNRDNLGENRAKQGKTGQNRAKTGQSGT